MSALKQYLDLYDTCRDAIDAGAAPVLNSRREAARKLLGEPDAKLPDRRTEDYERTSIDAMMSPDFGVNVNRVAIPADVAASFRCAVPHMSTLTGVVVNDAFHATSSLEGKLPEGVEFMSLRKAALLYPDLIDRFYSRIAPTDSVPEALNTLLVQDGVFIRVAKGIRPGKPLQLVNIFSSPASLLAPRRVLIVVEDDAALQLLVCDHTQTPDTSFMASQVTEISLGVRASLDLCDIEESSAQTSRHSMTHVVQAEGSRLNMSAITLTCGTTRNETTVSLDGPSAQTFLAGMAIGDGKMHIDNFTRVDHRAQRCTSNQLYKFVLDGHSTGAFEGSIKVAPGAKFTEAYQSNRNILASRGATMHTKPQLEIYNDDVKCSHGATTGQLDNAALFYMRSRGIPEHEARTMLMQAFMVDVIDTVSIDGLRERLRHLVDNRFRHNDDSCGECHSASCRNLHHIAES